MRGWFRHSPHTLTHTSAPHRQPRARAQAADTIIPAILKRDGTEHLTGDAVPILKAYFATPKPQSLPAGALSQGGGGEEKAGAGAGKARGPSGQKGSGKSKAGNSRK